MKRICPVCQIRIKSKLFKKHLKEKHDVEPFSEIRAFKCFEDCVHCCSDPVMSISITLNDLERISKFTKRSISEIFEDYCDINSLTMPTEGTSHIPTISFSIPCKFLENNKCSIYEVRPIGCTIFPALLDVPLNYRGYGYKCIDEGYFDFDSDKLEELEEAKKRAEDESNATVDYFGFLNYAIRFSATEIENIVVQVSKKTGIKVWMKIIGPTRKVLLITPGDVPRNKLREIETTYHKIVTEKLRERVGDDFLRRCRELDAKAR